MKQWDKDDFASEPLAGGVFDKTPYNKIVVARALVEVLDFQEPRWREPFLSGSTTPSLENKVVTASSANSSKIYTKHTLISLHGIRTRGAWQKQLQASCDRADAGIQHRPFDFGFFGTIQLIVPALRDRKIAWFLNEYTTLIKTEKNEETPPSIIAHSFGTYVIACAMEKHPEIRFQRVILCGSIIRRDYDWSTRFKIGQVEGVLNDYGRKDLWVRIAECVIDAAGSSGYRGFEDTAGERVVERQHKAWRHSDYFYPLNYDRNWIPFILGSMGPEPLQQDRLRKPNWRFRVTMAILIGLLLAAGYIWFPSLWTF